MMDGEHGSSPGSMAPLARRLVPAANRKVEMHSGVNITRTILTAQFTRVKCPGKWRAFMNPGSDVPFIAFEGDRAIASGNLHEVVSAAKETLDRRKQASILIFDGMTGGPVGIHFRGT